MQALLKRWQPRLWPALLALVPLALSVDQRIKILPIALLFLAGLWFVCFSAATRQSYRHAWPVVAAVLLLTGFIVFNVVIHRLGWRPVDRAAHILLFLLIAAVFTRTWRTPVLWCGFSLGAIALGAVCLLQRYGQGIERAYGLNGGPSASIELATVLLGLVLVALARLLGARAGKLERMLHVIAVAVGLYGALLTQSRGPLLAFVPALVLLVLLYMRRSGHWRLGLLMLLGAGVGATLTTFTMHDDIAARFAAIGPEVMTFDHRADARGAVRERLEMWRTAGRAVSAHPLGGIGIGEFSHYVAGEIAAGRSNASIGRYNQPHNEYVEAAATGGIPGLLVLLATFLLPLNYFVRYLRDTDEAVALPAWVGMSVIVLYMLCALTDSVFYRVMPQSFYFFMVLGMALLLARTLSMRAAAAERTAPAPGCAAVGHDATAKRSDAVTVGGIRTGIGCVPFRLRRSTGA